MLKEKETLTSRQNPTVKRVCALSEKKARRAQGLFRFDGVKLLREALAKRVSIRYVVLRESACDMLENELCGAVAEGRLGNETIVKVSDQVFEKMSEERSPEGVITVAEMLTDRHRAFGAEEAREYTLPRGESLLIAEALRDPGNLGTVIRSCAALGIDRLLISDDCADLYSPKTVRAAMGGIFSLKTDVVPTESLPDAVASLRKSGRRIYATALHERALSVGELALETGDCFVIGNEGHGLSPRLIAACDACAVIPMTEGSESLNAAAAAAICIWETVRRK